MIPIDSTRSVWTSRHPSWSTMRKNAKQNSYSITATRTTGTNPGPLERPWARWRLVGTYREPRPLPATHTRILGREPASRADAPDHLPLHSSFLETRGSFLHTLYRKRLPRRLPGTLWRWGIWFQQLWSQLLPHRWRQPPMVHRREGKGQRRLRNDCWFFRIRECNMCKCSVMGTQERAVQDLLCLVIWFIFGLLDLISAPPLSLSQIGYAIVLLCLVCFVACLYLGFRLWNGLVTLVKAADCFFLSLVLQDYRMPVCAQLLVMMLITGRLWLSHFEFKPVSWLAGDSRLRQPFSLRIHLLELQSLSSICPSTIISYLRSLEAPLVLALWGLSLVLLYFS